MSDEYEYSIVASDDDDVEDDDDLTDEEEQALLEQWKAAVLPGDHPETDPDQRQYTVSISNTFNATSPEDAVAQMVDYLTDSAHAAGYRVEAFEDDAVSEPYATWFIDADDFNEVQP